MIERHIVADLGCLADDDTHAVVNEEPPTDTRPWMNLDAGQPTPQVGTHSRQQLPFALPKPVRKAMDPDRVQARIAGNDL